MEIDEELDFEENDFYVNDLLYENTDPKVAVDGNNQTETDFPNNESVSQHKSIEDQNESSSDLSLKDSNESNETNESAKDAKNSEADPTPNKTEVEKQKREFTKRIESPIEIPKNSKADPILNKTEVEKPKKDITKRIDSKTETPRNSWTGPTPNIIEVEKQKRDLTKRIESPIETPKNSKADPIPNKTEVEKPKKDTTKRIDSKTETPRNSKAGPTPNRTVVEKPKKDTTKRTDTKTETPRNSNADSTPNRIEVEKQKRDFTKRIESPIEAPKADPNSNWVNSNPIGLPFRPKTLDLDRKYYDSMRIYLTTGKIIGYLEHDFKNEAKQFKLRNNKLLFNSREVVEGEERQQQIAIEFHLNAMAKQAKSRHRGVTATVRAIETKYFWGTIKFDVENIINHCRVCNPKEYDITSYQLWKYIEIGLIENVLVVRDLSEKSSIFNCAFLEDMNALNLSKHLIDLFKTYGTPNAIRIVLNIESQKQFIEELSQYLSKSFLEFMEEVKFVSQNSTEKEMIKLPMVEIKIEFDSNKCPKSEKELQTSYAITTDEEISVFYIFSCNQWLTSNSVFTTIATDIRNFAQKFNDWKSRVSSLTLYFQINGINLKANEEEEETNTSQSLTPKNKRTGNWRELERLTSDFKTSKPSSQKRQLKTEEKHKKKSVELSDSSSDWSDDNLSRASSKHSNASTRKKNRDRDHSKDKTNNKKDLKETPFKQLLRKQKSDERSSKDSIEVIDIDDSSQQSVVSLSSESQKSEPVLIRNTESNPSFDIKLIDFKTDLEKYDPEGNCNPCVVQLESFSNKDIAKAIEGIYEFQEKDNNEVISVKTVIHSQEILDTQDSNFAVEDNHSSNDSVDIPLTNHSKQENHSIKDIINEELEKRKRMSQTSVDLRLSESSSEDEEPLKQNNSMPVLTPNRSTTSAQPQNGAIPAKTTLKSKTPVTSRTKKRKQNSNDSDNDSDYDVRKDLSQSMASVSANKKQVKFNSSSKTLTNSKSNKKVRKVSKKLVVSASSGSESNDDNRENLKSNSIEKKQKTETNSEEIQEVFNCTRCDFQTNNKMNFIMHTSKHKDEPKKLILCPDCSKAFYSKDSLQRHKEEVHPPEIHNVILYGCDSKECKDFKCYSVEESDQHLMSHIEDLSYMKTSSKFRCSLCKAYTSANQEIMMSSHLTQKHRMLRCAFDCSFTAVDYQSIERHCKSIHPRYGLPFNCKYCEFSSAVFAALVQHRIKSHAIDWMPNQQNKCCLCDVYFDYDDTNRILEHLTTHSVDFPYFECKSCNKRCRHLEQLKKHCETHHAVGPADGIEEHILNLAQFFEELRQKLKDQTNKQTKTTSNPSETQNAILGLMDDQFAEESESQTTDMDLVAAALHFIFKDEEETPTISIPEAANGEDDYFIEEDEQGNWNPVAPVVHN